MEHTARKNKHPADLSKLWNDFSEKRTAHREAEPPLSLMESLVRNLPTPERTYLRSRPLRILDYGCAQGDGVKLLAQWFPQGKVSGVDGSAQAVEEAQRRYPEGKFFLAPAGEIPTGFDVIVNSICLKPLTHPVDLIKGHLRFCGKLYIALVPHYEPEKLPKSSETSEVFLPSFPDRLENFVRLCAKPIDVDPALGDARQFLVIYGSRSYLEDSQATDDLNRRRKKAVDYFASLPADEDRARHKFHAELVERIAELIPAEGKTLEVACGEARPSVALARSGQFRVSVMDCSSEALAPARRLFARQSVAAEFLEQDAFLPGEPEFDLVFHTGALEQYALDDQQALLRGMATRSRQYVLVLVPNRNCYWYWVWRLHQSAAGAWSPFREVPALDLSAVFEAAGLRFVGQTFLGPGGTEAILENLPDLPENLRQELLELHQSPLVPRDQKSFFVAALGSVAAEDRALPDIWRRPGPGKESLRVDLSPTLADALSLRMEADRRLAQLQIQVAERSRCVDELTDLALENEKRLEQLGEQAAEKDQVLEVQCAQLAEKDQALQALTAELAEKDQALQTRTAELAEKDQALQGLTNHLSERDRVLQELAGCLAEKGQTLQGLSSRLSEKDQALQTLTTGLAEQYRSLEALRAQAVEAEQALQVRLATITGGKGWRLLQVIWRVRALVAPRGSRRARLAGMGWRVLRKVRQGPRPLAAAIGKAAFKLPRRERS